MLGRKTRSGKAQLRAETVGEKKARLSLPLPLTVTGNIVVSGHVRRRSGCVEARAGTSRLINPYKSVLERRGPVRKWPACGM